MTDAGFDSRGVASMFEKLQQASRINDNGSFPYLRSHPLTTQRIAEAQSRLQLVVRDAAVSSSSAGEAAQARVLHAMMASRARVLGNPGVDALRSMLAEAQRQVAPPTRVTSAVPPTLVDVRTTGALYAGALAAAKLRDFPVARSFAEKLKLLASGNPAAVDMVNLLSLEVDLTADVLPSAVLGIDISKTTVRAGVLIQSRALLAAGRPSEVADRLNTWVTAHPKDALAWQQLAVAYGNLKQNVRAIRADAEGRVAQLDYTAALDRFKAAQGMMRSDPGSADFVEGSIIDTRTRQLESLVKERALQDKLDR